MKKPNLVTAIDQKTGHHVRVTPAVAENRKDRYKRIDAPAVDVNGRPLPAKPALKPKTDTKTTATKKEG